MRALGVHADGEIGDQAGAHPVVPAGALRLAIAAADQPLQEDLELDFRLMGEGEGLGGGARPAQLFRPAPQRGIAATQRAVQQFKQRKILQQRGRPVAKTAEVAMNGFSRQRQLVVEGAEQRALGLMRGGPVDQRRARKFLRTLAQARRLEARRTRGSGKTSAGSAARGLQEQARGRRIGAVALRRGAEQRVDGRDRQEIGAEPRRGTPEPGHAAEIADAAIMRRAQGIDLRGQPPAGRAAAEVRECHAALRRDGDRAVAGGKMQAMVARLFEPRQGKAPRRALDRADQTRRSVFQRRFDPVGRGARVRQDDRLVDPRRDKPQARVPGLGVDPHQGFPQFAARARGKSERGENRAQAFVGDAAIGSGLVAPENRDARAPCKVFEHFVRHDSGPVLRGED